MINENQYLEYILEALDKEDFTRPVLTSVGTWVRTLFEKHYYKKSNEWKILHSFIHEDSTEVSKGMFFRNIVIFMLQMKNGKKELKDKIIERIMILFPLEDTDFYTFKKIDNKVRRLNVLIKEFKVISTNPLIYLCVGIQDKTGESIDRKDIFFFSKIILITGAIYDIELINVENTIHHRYYQLINKRIYFNSIPNFETFNWVFEKAIENSISPTQLLFSEETLEKIVNQYHKETETKKIWPSSLGSDRGIFKLLLSITHNLKYILEIVRNGNPNDLYPFFLNPLSASTAWKRLHGSIIINLAKIYKISNSEINVWKSDYNVLNMLKSNSLLMMTKKNIEKQKDPKTLIIEGLNSYSIWSKRGHVSIQNNFFLLKIMKDITKNSKTVIAPAGFGKSTWVTNEIIKSGKKVILYTPTFKAQEVYKNYKNDKNITMVNIQKISKGTGNFEEADIYVFDEISMYSKNDWLEIKKIIGKDIYLIGDPYQLPPINEFNFSKYIEYFKSAKKIELSINYRIKESDNKRELEKLFIDLRKRKIIFGKSGYSKLFFGYEKYSDVFNKLQKLNGSHNVLVYKNNGIISVNNINRILSNRSGSVFEVGDDVIFSIHVNKIMGHLKKNLYTGKKMKIKKIEKMQSMDGNTQYKYIFPGDVDVVSWEGSEPFSLPMCLTTHKAQGQSIDNVAIIIDIGKNIDFNWLYTAASRVKKDLIIFIHKDSMVDIDHDIVPIPSGTSNALND